MKFLDRLGLAVFSIIVFILAVMMCLLLFGNFDAELIINGLNAIKANQIATNCTIGVSIALILLSFKCMFFESYSKYEDKSREGILLENDNGKLLVSRDTLENLTTSVAKSTKDVESAATSIMLDKEKHLIIFINLQVRQQAIIKDLSSGLQARVKQTIKDSLGLDVKEVNIKIRNIVNEKKQEKNDKDNKASKIIKDTKDQKEIKEVREPKEIKLN